MDPASASLGFFNALRAQEKKIPYLEKAPVTVMAATVQKPDVRYVGEYAKHQTQAEQLLKQFSGASSGSTPNTKILPDAPSIPKQTTSANRSLSSSDATQSNVNALLVLNAHSR